MTIRNRLKVILAEKNMSQTDLAESIGISRGTLSNIINGNQNATLETAIDIADFLEKPLESIFFKEKNVDMNFVNNAFAELITQIKELYSLYEEKILTEIILIDFYKLLINDFKEKFGYRILDNMLENNELENITNSIAIELLFK